MPHPACKNHILLPDGIMFLHNFHINSISPNKHGNLSGESMHAGNVHDMLKVVAVSCCQVLLASEQFTCMLVLVILPVCI